MKWVNFKLTPDQILDQSKDVTRRLSDDDGLRVGAMFQPFIYESIKHKDDTVRTLGGTCFVIKTSREPLRIIIDDKEYGVEECRREGFPNLSPDEFVKMFCNIYKNCTPDSLIIRIEFQFMAGRV